MPEANAKSRRRWFQFSLRTLLIAVTLFVGLLATWRAYVEPYGRQREVMTLIRKLGGSYETKPGGPQWMREWFGPNNFQDISLVNLADCDKPAAYVAEVAALPRLDTLLVGGFKFTDDQLRRFQRLRTLRALILDSTNVTGTGIDAFERALRGTVVYRSQRRAIAKLRQSKVRLKTRTAAYAQLRNVIDSEYFEEVTKADYYLASAKDEELIYLKPLTTLIDLSLYTTRIGDAGLAHIKGLTALEKLYLTNTRVSDAGLAHLRGMTRLKVLALSGLVTLSDAGLARISGLTNLEILWLSRNQVTNAGLIHLRRMAKLRLMSICGMDISEAGLAHLKSLTRLDDLDLSHTKVSDLTELTQVPRLRTLFLNGSPVNDAGLASLHRMPALRNLILNNTLVTDAGLVHLKKLTRLELLELEPSLISDEGVKRLRAALPNCRIRYRKKLAVGQ